METSEIKDFYNKTLKGINNTYENERWFKSSQARGGYINTRSAVEQFALPLLKSGMNVLELGPGPGTWTKILLAKASNCSFDLVDISEQMLKQAHAALGEHTNITYINSDILDFSPSKSYDFFFSSRIIEYVPNKAKAIETIAKSLKPGSFGYIVTKTPQKKRPFGRAIQSPVHANQIEAHELAVLFETAGCVVQRKVHVTCVFPGLRSGFADRILTALCRKMPFSFGRFVSESYALVFQKK